MIDTATATIPETDAPVESLPFSPVYGGSAAGLSANNTLSWISGSGTLRVRHGISGGTILIIR